MLKRLLSMTLLWGILSGVAYWFWLRNTGDIIDFWARYEGARQAFAGNKDIYAFGTVANNNSFLYPATIIWILLPFWLLPYTTAFSAWIGLNALIALIMPQVILDLTRATLQPQRQWALVLLVMLFHLHTMMVLMLGQFSLFAVGSYALALWALSREHDILAGVALVGGSIRPDAILITAVLLVFLLVVRHYRVVISFTLAMGFVTLLSFIQLGWWIPDFLDGIRFYRNEGGEAYTDPIPSLISSPVMQIILFSLIILWLLYATLWRAPQLPQRLRPLWILSVGCIGVLLLATQSKSYTLVYTLIPMWFIVSTLLSRRPSLALLILVVFTLLPSIYLGLFFAPGAENYLGGVEILKVEQLVTPLMHIPLLTWCAALLSSGETVS